MKNLHVHHPVETTWVLSVATAVDPRGVFRLALCLVTPLGRQIHEFESVPQPDERTTEIVRAFIGVLNDTPWYERPDRLLTNEAAIIENVLRWRLKDLDVAHGACDRVIAKSQKAFERMAKENPRYDVSVTAYWRKKRRR